VRRAARDLALPTAETRDSQDICFVRTGSYHEFLESKGVCSEPGPITTLDGREVGRHRGLHRYTVGQRKELGVALGRPYYVVEKRVADNALVIGTLEELQRSEVAVRDVNWCDLPAGGWPSAPPEKALGMLRYRSRPCSCEVADLDGDSRQMILTFEEPVVAAPGQFAVIYSGENGRVVAGGRIA